MADHLVAILRHGKANQQSPTGLDADRPLLDRGIRQARWMGETLADEGFADARVVCSPAVRTRQTAELIAEALGVEIGEDERLFLNGTVQSVFELLADLADLSRVVVVGHNPTLSLVASTLTHGVGPCEVSLRTGAAAVCSHAGVIEPGSARLVGVWRTAQK